jgi:hypothetical protein
MLIAPLIRNLFARSISNELLIVFLIRSALIAMILSTRCLLLSLSEFFSLRKGIVLIEAKLHFVFILYFFTALFSLLENVRAAHLVILLCEFLQPADFVGIQ